LIFPSLNDFAIISLPAVGDEFKKSTIVQGLTIKRFFFWFGKIKYYSVLSNVAMPIYSFLPASNDSQERTQINQPYNY